MDQLMDISVAKVFELLPVVIFVFNHCHMGIGGLTAGVCLRWVSSGVQNTKRALETNK